MPAIGGLPDMAKVSASGRQSLSGDFAALSLALKFAFPAYSIGGARNKGREANLPLRIIASPSCVKTP
jgi:hypothetical protein